MGGIDKSKSLKKKLSDEPFFLIIWCFIEQVIMLVMKMTRGMERVLTL